MKPWDLQEVCVRTQFHGNTTACARGALAAGAVLVVPTEQEAQRARSMAPGVRTFSLARGAAALVGTVDAYVVDPSVLAVIATEWDAQVSRAERERDEARRELADARRDLAAARDEIDRLRAELAEAEATIANERGEGEAPCEGWERNDFGPEVISWTLYLDAEGQPVEMPDGMTERLVLWAIRDRRSGDVSWDVDECDEGTTIAHGDADTLRAAMRAATAAAKGGAE